MFFTSSHFAMSNFIIWTGLLVLVAVKLGYGADFFGFSVLEQQLWPNSFPECGGQRQSPIQLNRFGEQPIPSNGSLFILRRYNHILPQMKLTNTGSTVSLSIDPSAIRKGTRIPFITGSILKHRYRFDSLHLHWSRGIAFGSEHLIGKARTPLELHIVHKRVRRSTATSQQQRDELAVLGVMYRMKRKGNHGLKPIIRNLRNIRAYNSSTSVQGLLTLGSFLGDINRGKFYNYEGSLTTPPCTEGVTWFVFSDMLSCTASQLNQLRKLRRLDRNGNPTRMIETNRVLQSRNNRKINFYMS